MVLELTIGQALQQAAVVHKEGKLQDAERLYRAILQTQPKHADANHNLGVLAAGVGKTDAALRFFKTALEANPKQGQYWLSYIDTLIKVGQTDNAKQVLQQARQLGLQGEGVDRLELQLSQAEQQKSPSQVEINALINAFNLGQYAEAERLALATTRTHPHLAFGWKALGAALRHMGRTAEALMPMQKSAQLMPNDSEAHRNLGVTLRDLGRPEEAEASYRQAITLKPDYAEAHSALGNALRDLGRLEEAEASYRQAITLKPDYAEAHSALGNALRALGRQKDAEASYRQVITLKPDCAEAHSNLGCALLDLGRQKEAEASYRQAITLKPDCAEAHSNLGCVLRDLGRPEESEASYRQAITLKPDYAEAHSNLGSALLDLGRPEEAEASYRQAITLKPDYAEAHSNLGSALRDLGRPEESEASYRQALAINPNLMSALTGLGVIQIADGKFGDAKLYLEKALEVEPEAPTPWAQLTRLRKMTLDDHEWLETAQRIINNPGKNLIEKCMLLYAMGKYCDDVKNYSQAFNYFRQANDIKRWFQKKFQPDLCSKTVDKVIEYFSANRIARRHDGANDSIRPLFIVGMPRSGTSLLEQIVASHPLIHGAGELKFWSMAINRFANHQAKDFSSQEVAKLAVECLSNLDGCNKEALRVVDKMPSNFMHLGFIHTAFPNARILHTQRNPVDTCLSIYFQNFYNSPYAHDLNDLAHYYREYHRLMSHWRINLPQDVFLEVPYEALVEDQEGWSRKVIEFIGLEWDEKCLDFYKTERRVNTSSDWQVRQPVYKTSKARWRNYEQFVGPLVPLLELYQPASA